MQPFGHVPGRIDVTLDGLGDVDLRNEMHVVAIRFLPGIRDMSLAFDFAQDPPDGERVISLEFDQVEIIQIEPYLEKGVDPIYGYALLFDIDHWTVDSGEDIGREGFTVATTTLEISFYATELTASISNVAAK